MDTETQILHALQNLEAATQAIARGESAVDLQRCFAQIDALAQQLPADADPELRHFLARKSYTKARERLARRERPPAP